MTEPRRDWPTGLPLGPDAPVFTPPDPATLLQRGRHTRRMHAVVASSTVIALMAVGSAVAVNASVHRADRLKVVTPAVHRTPTPHGSPNKLSSPTGDNVTALGSGPQAFRPTNAVASPVDVPPTPGVNPVPTVPTISTASPLRRTRMSEPPTSSCVYQPSSAPSGWCLDYPGPAKARAGVPVDLSVDICRINGLGTGTLRFSNAQEADVSVYGQSRRQSWNWSHGREFAATPHTLSVPAGQCLRWTTLWTTEANSGAQLPPGSYSIQVSVLSPDVDLPNTVTGTATDFTIT